MSYLEMQLFFFFLYSTKFETQIHAINTRAALKQNQFLIVAFKLKKFAYLWFSP